MEFKFQFSNCSIYKARLILRRQIWEIQHIDIEHIDVIKRRVRLNGIRITEKLNRSIMQDFKLELNCFGRSVL